MPCADKLRMLNLSALLHIRRDWSGDDNALLTISPDQDVSVNAQPVFMAVHGPA